MKFVKSYGPPVCAHLLAALVLMIVAQPSYAGLVFRNVGVTLNASAFESYDLDVDLNGSIDFRFNSVFAPDPLLPVGFNVIDFPFSSGNGVVIDMPTGDGFPTTSRLGIGATVSSANAFSLAGFDQGNLSFFTPFDPPSGNFEGRTGFIGFRFDRLGGTAFGFAEITVRSVNASVNPLGLTIGHVAFNDQLGQAVTVSAVPEPSSMVLASIGLVVFGGYALRRNRRSADSLNELA